MQGTVKKWFDEKGYGFIQTATGDVFVHFTGIAGVGRRDLVVGEVVEFDVKQAARGPMAYNVYRKVQ